MQMDPFPIFSTENGDITKPREAIVRTFSELGAKPARIRELFIQTFADAINWTTCNRNRVQLIP